MDSHRALLAVASGLLLGLAVAGCGEGEPAPKKVDVSAQIAALKGDNDAKAVALSELAAGGPNAAGAVKEIIPLLKSDDPVVRRLAAYTLGQIGAPAKEAVPGLTAMLQDPDGNAVTAAINALRAIDPSKAPSDNIPNVTQ
ncbi:MAG: HEAT repeat domain-containing protein [Verrucomicrobiota bacterium]